MKGPGQWVISENMPVYVDPVGSIAPMKLAGGTAPQVTLPVTRAKPLARFTLSLHHPLAAMVPVTSYWPFEFTVGDCVITIVNASPVFGYVGGAALSRGSTGFVSTSAPETIS